MKNNDIYVIGNLLFVVCNCFFAESVTIVTSLCMQLKKVGHGILQEALRRGGGRAWLGEREGVK